MADNIRDIILENATILFRNFSGRGTDYNPVGKRNFCVVLDEETAERLSEIGWKVRTRPPREEGDDPLYYMQVEIKYRDRKGDELRNPPKIYKCTSTSKKLLTEETVGQLDWDEILNTDVIISHYNWVMNGKTGFTACVKSMYVTIEEDAFSAKYEHLAGDGPIEEAPYTDEDVPF